MRFGLNFRRKSPSQLNVLQLAALYQNIKEETFGVNLMLGFSSINRMMKSHLDTKICPVCNRPFQWRKKWKRDWEEVKYCSKRCSSERKKSAKSEAS